MCPFFSLVPADHEGFARTPRINVSERMKARELPILSVENFDLENFCLTNETQRTVTGLFGTRGESRAQVLEALRRALVGLRRELSARKKLRFFHLKSKILNSSPRSRACGGGCTSRRTSSVLPGGQSAKKRSFFTLFATLDALIAGCGGASESSRDVRQRRDNSLTALVAAPLSFQMGAQEAVGEAGGRDRP